MWTKTKCTDARHTSIVWFRRNTARLVTPPTVFIPDSFALHAEAEVTATRNKAQVLHASNYEHGAGKTAEP